MLGWGGGFWNAVLDKYMVEFTIFYILNIQKSIYISYNILEWVIRTAIDRLGQLISGYKVQLGPSKFTYIPLLFTIYIQILNSDYVKVS